MLKFLKKLFGGRSAEQPSDGGSVQSVVAGQSRAEARLRQSEEHFGQLVAGVRDYAVFLLDQRGNVLTWNAGAERIKGYRAEEIVGQHFSRFYPNDAISSGWPGHELSVAAATGRFEDEGWRVRKDGTTFWANVVITALRDEGGEVRGYIKITRDRTDRKQAEEKLRLSEERFRLMVEGVRDYAIFMLDPEGHVATWNAGAEALKGYKASEIVGQHFSKFYPQEAIDRGWPGEELRRAAAEARFEDEGWRLRKDGTTFWANVVITALRDDLGQLRGFSKITRDLTGRKQAEESLRQSEERFRLLVEGVGDYAIFMLDPEGHVATWNAGAERIKGYRAEEIVGQHFSKFYPQEALDRGWPAHELKVAAAEGRFEDEGWRLRKDGSLFWANVVITALHDESGALRGFAKVTRDLTERRRAEEQARRLFQEEAARRAAEEASRKIDEQRERLRTTLASIGDAVITTDTEGRITNLNPVAETLTGWATGEAVVQPLDAVFRIVNEQTRQPVESPVTRALREGVIVGLANHTVLIAKGGTERPIDDSAAPIRCSEGTVVGCVLVFRDVTERRRAEETLRRREAELREAQRVAHVGSWHWDAGTDVTTGSDELYRIYGLDPNTQPFPDFKDQDGSLYPHDSWRRLNEAVQQAVQTGVGYELDVEAFRGGERIWVTTRSEVVRGVGGAVVGLRGTVQDITARKRAEDELRQVASELSEADRRKDEFLAMLAHELRSPLAPIRNALQIMKLTEERGPREEARTLMERQLEQMVRLVDDLMDISRITRGRVELRRERVQLAAVLNSAVETSRPLIEQMGHELTLTLPKQPVVVDADLTRLAQVFMNLLNNAAKYTEPGGRITLKAEREGSDVVVSVRDTGIGIPADKLASIFEMFSQVDRSLEKAQGGLGIGLTLVKRLTEMHGGTVEAKSDGPGGGSEFAVRLPVVVEGSVPQRGGDHDKASAPRSMLRILIVDDNRDGADSLATMLRLMGNDTRTAYDGQEGVEVAQQFRPEVVLLDIGLPKLNGYETCRRIREQPGGKELVIIAQTGWGAEEDRQRTHEAGFDHHLVKPVDPSALMKLLTELQAVRR